MRAERHRPGASQERGQASIELLAGLPLLLAAALLAGQLLLTGYALTLADGSAEAGAIAAASGGDAAEAARAALPGWARDRAEISTGGGRVRVEVEPPAPVGALGDLLSVGLGGVGASRRAVTATVLVSGTRPRESLALAAAIAVEAESASGSPTALVELRPEPRRRTPTLLCSPAAREIEAELRGAGLAASARGRVCHLSVADEEEALAEVAVALPACGAEVAVVQLPGRFWVPALESALTPAGGALAADPVAERSMAALAVGELRRRGLPARVEMRPPGPLAARRALAGIRPGGEASLRAARIAAALIGTAGHAE